jgi:choice-of-anchor B domain-containing protein
LLACFGELVENQRCPLQLLPFICRPCGARARQFSKLFNKQILLMKLSLSLLALTLTLGLTAQNQNITFRSKMTFPGQTIANVCGWAGGGHEYALLGGSDALIIVDVTDPDAPTEIVQVPGPNSLWKEIKTYSHYAYTVSEGGQGVNIVDLSGLPSATLNSHFYKGDGAIANQLNTIHALHIDVAKGYLYAYGSNLFSGGAVVLDLNADPYNPTYVGKFDQLGYIHDGYVDNDTLYAAHINVGIFSIVDMTDKSNPVVLGTQSTPNNFTHNTWLSDDRQTIFTTDETNNSFLASYDVSDPAEPQFLGKVQSNPGPNSIVHNTHIRGDYAVTAWYTDGVTIVDVARPDNLVQTGNYDSYAGSGGGFDGCWGVYPYLPSGNLIVGNITPGEMYVLSPTYIRACYLEGTVTDATTGQPINNATVKIIGNPNAQVNSGINGGYKTGQVQPGAVSVEISKLGYLAATVSANLVTGEVTALNASLTPSATFNFEGLVVRSADGTSLPNAHVALVSPEATFETDANPDGTFNISGIFAGTYDIVAGAWGYQYKVLSAQAINSNNFQILDLETGYQDDFVFDYGWEASGSSQTGDWEIGEPIGIDVGILLSPEHDVEGDVGNTCYVTGNSTGDVDADDVESGSSILRSPPMDLSGYLNPRISAQLWCVSVNQQFQSLDSIKVYIGNGSVEKLAWKAKGDVFEWQPVEFDVTDFVPLTSTMRLRILARDNPGVTGLDSYEAAFDQFLVTDQPLATGEPTVQAELNAAPNPFKTNTLVKFDNAENGSRLRVLNALGQVVQTLDLAGDSGQATIGQGLRPGVYFVQLEQKSSAPKIIRVLKAE